MISRKRFCASVPGEASAIASFRTCWSMMRFRSAASMRGFIVTSATSATNGAAKSLRTSPPTWKTSDPAVVPTDPPISAAWREMSWALRVVVPSRSMSPRTDASETSFGPWSMMPVRSWSSTATLGTRPKGTIVTSSPFGSVMVRRGGTLKSLGVPGAGGSSFCAGDS